MEIDFFWLCVNLLGGLAIFLYGMELMTDALKDVAGTKLRSLLAKLTTNRVSGAATGAFVTAVIQSSSVTTVLVVGFISAGLMTLEQSVGVIMGANIGTTITAQMIAFKVTKYSMILIAVGFSLLFFAKDKQIKSIGNMMMGLGLIFFGMYLMSEATRPLRTYDPFIEYMKSMDQAMLGVIVGAAFTAVVQSSSATTGIVIVLASQGFISLEAGIALAFGANVGTCATAMLASIGKSRRALQAALAHVVFNVSGVLIWIFFIDYLADFVRAISPVHDVPDGMEKLAKETPRQVANAHTIFNLSNTIIFLPFSYYIAKLINTLCPDKKAQIEDEHELLYLDDMYLHNPELALHQVQKEIGHLSSHVLDMVEKAPEVILQGKIEEVKEIEKMDDVVDFIYVRIAKYMGALSQESLSSEQRVLMDHYISINNHLENIGDSIETNLVGLAFDRIEEGVVISDGTIKKMKPMLNVVTGSMKTLTSVLNGQGQSDLKKVLDKKKDVRKMGHDIVAHLGERLSADAPKRMETYKIENDIIEQYNRIFYFNRRIARRLELVIKSVEPLES
ncbi:MAG: Na/Pi cotransporter family protein [Planctomycetes bacterium]|nr:Na/Pi cotransporter family protein [Planctomycetota bacterium]